jgi:hypothetical protein
VNLKIIVADSNFENYLGAVHNGYSSVLRSLKIFLLLAPLAIGIGHAQVTIDSLSAEISIYGDVVLHWTIPQGMVIAKYTIYRGTDYDNMKIIAEIPFPVVKQYTDLNSQVTPGTSYIYGLKAMDVRGQSDWEDIVVKVTPPPTALKFISVPPISVFVNGNYYYYPIRTDAPNPDDVEITLPESNPGGMQLNTVGSGSSSTTFLYWRPQQAGSYKVTLLAKHRQTRAVAVQEYFINVAYENQIGTVRGIVRNVEHKPLVNATVQILQLKYNMLYNTRTDTAGVFEITSVQTGDIYAYAAAPSDRYMPQWYSLGRNITDVSPRSLNAGDTLSYEFYLLTSPNSPTLVAGMVKDQMTGLPIDSARVSFVRKASFLNIGDTTINRNPSSRMNFVVDTTVMTGVDGRYTANLIVGRDYYVIVEHPKHLSCFNVDRTNLSPTNALDARPIRVSDSMTDMNFSLVPNTILTTNRIVGIVRNATNGLEKQAVVVLINPDLQRGSGGTHTYRLVSSVSGKNGFYSFDNLDIGTYSILALPLDKDLMPQYFTWNGGTSLASASEIVNPNGTMQNYDFPLAPVAPGGVGTIFGKVTVRTNNGEAPAPGTVVFALMDDTKEVAGYAISDSTGWYSITGLPKGNFVVIAQSIDLGSAQSPLTELDYSTLNQFTQVIAVHLVIDQRTTGLEQTTIPQDVTLDQNYPNPFNPTTQIRFGLPASGHVTLRIFNALGNEVQTLVSEKMSAGLHAIDFDARAFGSGTYYYQLQFGARLLTRSMLLVK